MVHTLCHLHRRWNSAPATTSRLDHQDGFANQEHSLSARYGFLRGQDLGRCRLEIAA